MSNHTQLFDRAARRRHRDRAARQSADSAFFLHEQAALGLAERLSIVRRDFPEAAIFGAASRAYAEHIQALGKVDRLRVFESAPELAARSGAEIGDIEASPLAPVSQDLIVFGLELHAANDPVGALIQARRALRPDGLLLAALLAGGTLTELRAALATAETEISDGLSPRVAPMGELRDLGGLLQRAGFALPVADSDRLTLWCMSPLKLMREIRAMGAANNLQARRRETLRRDVLFRAAEIYQQRFARADGKIRASVEIAYLTGWAPSETQPRPLKPGDAARRLADALGVDERSTGEPAPHSAKE